MGAGTWEIHDPAVSELVFIPGFKTVRQALLKDHQLFWSRLRGMGQPILANEVQTAPLFPLTLALISIPDPYFYHVYCLMRFILIGSLCLMLASQVFQMSRLSSFAFMICFGFSVYALRWINHAWLNGLLSGLLYLFSSAALLVHLKENTLRPKHAILLSLAVYCMVTSGFPEASLMAGLLTLFVLFPNILVSIAKREVSGLSFFGFFFLAHAAGGLIASPQVFALVEYLGEHGTELGESFRDYAGKIQYEGVRDLFPMVTRFLDSPPAGVTIHFFNLIPIFLFLTGLGAIFRKRKLGRYDWGAILCLLFTVLKLFPTSAYLNECMMHLPLFRETWFVVYFFTIPIFFFAYFVARGVEQLERNVQTGTLDKKAFLIATGLTATLFLIPFNIYETINAFRVSKIVLLFLGFLGILWVSTKRKMKPRHFGILLSLFLLAELLTVRPIHFLPYGIPHFDVAFGERMALETERVLTQKGFSLLNSRDQTAGGRFAAVGLSTMNNGSPPIVTKRLDRLLGRLFYQMPGWGSAMPVYEQRLPYSYQLLGVNIYFGQSAKLPVPRDTRKFEKLGVIEGRELWVDHAALSRTYFSNRCVEAPNGEFALAFLSDAKKFRLGDAVVEGLTNQERSVCKNINTPVQFIQVEEDRGRFLRLSTIKGPGVVVVSDLQFPGWSAVDRLSGAPLNVKNINYIFKGVILPSKTSYGIDFFYTPTWWTKSQQLILVGLIILVFQLFLFHDRVTFLWTRKVGTASF